MKDPRLLAVVSVLLLSACAHKLGPLPAGYSSDPLVLDRADSLGTSLDRVVEAGPNLQRARAIESRLLQFHQGFRREPIDWWSLQDNIVVELPGTGDGIAYVVAHYDKTDINPLKVVSVLLNGALDEPIGFSYFSEGALDNGTGVAVALELVRALQARDRKLTWRVLFAGSEESGLRGARAHVARMSNEDWARVRFAINVDSVALASEPNCVVDDGNDEKLNALAKRAAGELGFELGYWEMPSLAGGDHEPFQKTSFGWDVWRGFKFNLVAGLLPQRSWFTGSHGTRTVSFGSCNLIDAGDYASSLIILPVGRLHGPRDNRGNVDRRKLYEQFAIIERMTRMLEDEPVTE